MFKNTTVRRLINTSNKNKSYIIFLWRLKTIKENRYLEIVLFNFLIKIDMGTDE